MNGAVYRIPDPDGDGDVLIFDAGYENGDLHVYRHEESIQASDIVEQAQNEGREPESRAYLGHALSNTKFGTRPARRWQFEH